MTGTKYIGMDVHKESISIAVACRGKECSPGKNRRDVEVRLQPDLRPPPPTRCLRDCLPREDSSAPRCINFLPPRRSRLPRKLFCSVFLAFFFLAIAAQ
jgi:hypothetical protein